MVPSLQPEDPVSPKAAGPHWEVCLLNSEKTGAVTERELLSVPGLKALAGHRVLPFRVWLRHGRWLDDAGGTPHLLSFVDSFQYWHFHQDGLHFRCLFKLLSVSQPLSLCHLQSSVSLHKMYKFLPAFFWSTHFLRYLQVVL